MIKKSLESADQTTSIYSDIFPEMAISLRFFIERLYFVLAENKTEQVFFLSREGQLLMRMFELFQAQKGKVATSHYLKVSRRSTLLASLAPLECESFLTLFRQYRRISLYEFLSSLALESYCGQFENELGLSSNESHERLDDFPTSHLFAKLKALPSFSAIYEKERTDRRDAFVEYLSNLSGGKLPSRVIIVDVGWKGTIQDNLFALLCRNKTSAVKTVVGYYIGLVSAGAAGSDNEKHGLLFSCVGMRSPHFHIFNENRALFEILLAADHGSVASYTIDSDGARPVLSEFEEGDMLIEKVFPVQQRIMECFERLSCLGRAPLTLRRVALSHARMVFKPTHHEIDWFSSVFHVENYGVFERSYFNGKTVNPSFHSRICFIANVMRTHGNSTLGFWPWLSLRDQGGLLPAFVYATIRRLQY